MMNNRSSAGWSLRKGLFLSFGLAILPLFTLTQVLIVFGVPHTSFKGLWARHIQKEIAAISAMADARKNQLKQWVEERRGDLRTTAGNPWLPRELQAILHQSSSADRAEAEESMTRLRLYLQRVESSYYGEYSRVEIIAANSGTVLVSTRPEEEGRNASQTSYFSKFMNPSVEEVMVSEPEGGNDKIPNLIFARAIQTPSEESTPTILAVLVFHSPMGSITRTLLHEGIGRTGEIVLVDQNSLLMAPLRYPLADGSVARPLVFVNPAKPAALAARGIETVIEAPDYRGVAVLAATRHLRVTSELAWGLVVKIDKSEIFQPIRETLIAHALVLAGALLTGGLMILLIATRLTRPLATLSQAAVSIADGDLSVRTMPRGSRELQDLSCSFNIMAARLEHWHQDLAAAVEKRTAELREANEALQENRATLKQVLDTTPQSIFWKDLQGVYLGCNRVFAKAVGLDDPEKIKGKTDFDLPWPKEEAEAYRADDREVTQGNQTKRHIIEPLQQADGSRLWIDTTKVPLQDRDSKVIGVLGVYEDITERKRAEEKIVDLSCVLENSLNEIFVFDAKSLNFLFVNKGALKNIGFTQAEMLSLTPIDIKPEFTRESFLLTVQPLLTGEKEILNFETVHKRKNNTLYNVEIHLQLATYEGKKVFVAIILDITERKRAEEEREELDTRLRQSQKMEAIGTLAGGIAHDFNNILAAIFGYTELALEEDNPEKRRQDLEQVLSGAERAKQLVKQILTFSRRTEQELQPLQVAIVVK